MIKRTSIKSLTAFVTAVLVLCLSLITAFAAEASEYKVNGQTVKSGDAVTYILRLSGLNKKVAGINVTVKYDDKHLSVMKDTVNFPVFTDAVCNTEMTGKIVFNAASAVKGYELTDESVLFSISFKIKDAQGDISKITSTITELFDMDVEKVASDSYKIDDSVVEGTLPNVLTPDDVDKRIEEAKKNNAKSAADQGSSVNMWIIIGGAAVLLCIAAAGVIIMIKRNSKNAVIPAQDTTAHNHNDAESTSSDENKGE